MSVKFHTSDINFELKQKSILKKWIISEIELKGFSPGDINLIFCSDKYLLQINQQYLKHDYFTDIITFDYSENPRISGDLFISIDRVTENSLSFETSFKMELLRVMIHGVLHLLGFKDETPELKNNIHLLEDEALERLLLLL